MITEKEKRLGEILNKTTNACKDRLISETIRNTNQKGKYKPEKERCDAITKENQIIEK